MTVSGSVTLNGPSTAAIDLSKLRLTVAPADEPAFKAEGLLVRDVAVTADGQFTVRGVVPGRYRVVAHPFGRATDAGEVAVEDGRVAEVTVAVGFRQVDLASVQLGAAGRRPPASR